MGTPGRTAPTGPAPERVLTLPNLISASRLALVPVFAWLALAGQDLWALAVLAVAGASDWLDGVLARRLDQRSRLGELLDPSADRLFILVTLVVLTVRDVVPLWLVLAVVGRDLLLALVLLVLTFSHVGPLPVHFVGKAGTFALLYAFPLLLLAQWAGAVGDTAGVIGWAFAWWGVGLYWLAAMIYLRQGFGEVVRRRRRA
ncbi:CDP-diacylglycerol--glycerol-3-phosphate 3-phosphatidyltransferase [Cellulomonas bogoriensis 69B4 = DSM 16987]|uniref:CDP-diacylglycerol--glycerol-3-phosphate 3-phosphatidyltransferase n=1 Tax=Cellulomonas bogoriensis 69B4 = DSM 16987 TaxID=1386082 RepID=A0A0A0C1Y5_9CELL|nr:CDP-diacylglycerol--glycerol-3-phosphate 3-phosphatidyltransferase [Cellulomonas bogoriensis 69B4 = DSM 16987]